MYSTNFGSTGRLHYFSAIHKVRAHASYMDVVWNDIICNYTNPENMRYALEDEELPKGSFHAIICQQTTGAVFSPTGGWYYKNDDFCVVFDNKEEAMEWIEQKIAKTYNVEIVLKDSSGEVVEIFDSEMPTETDQIRRKPFWKFWGN